MQLGSVCKALWHVPAGLGLSILRFGDTVSLSYCVYIYIYMYIYIYIMYVYMYVCTDICMYVRIYVCMHVFLYVRMYASICLSLCMYVCMYVCMCVCVCLLAWMHGCMDAWMHGCMYVCKYACMYVHMYICTYVCMHVGVYVCIIYVYIRNLNMQSCMDLWGNLLNCPVCRPRASKRRLLPELLRTCTGMPFADPCSLHASRGLSDDLLQAEQIRQTSETE